MASEIVSPQNSNFTELPIKQLNTCEKQHQCEFFCARCDTLFCGGCWVRKHVIEFSSHEHLELNDAISHNKQEIAQSLNVLAELSGPLEALIEAKNRQLQNTENEFLALFTQVRRQMSLDINKDRFNELQAARTTAKIIMRQVDCTLPEGSINAISAQRIFAEKTHSIIDRVRSILDEEKQNLTENDVFRESTGGHQLKSPSKGISEYAIRYFRLFII